MRNKLHSSRGETLVEVLASIVIASLSVALLFSCVMTSSKIARDAEGIDAEHYADLTTAEAQDEAAKISGKTISISSKKKDGADTWEWKEPKKFPIYVFGDMDEEDLFSYRKAGVSGGP